MHKDDQVQQLWQAACSHLKNLLSDDAYLRWIAVIAPRSLDDEVLTLCVSNDFYQDWLQENYLPLIRDALTAVCGRHLQILFQVDTSAVLPSFDMEAGDGDTAASAAAPAKRPGKEKARPVVRLNPKYTFDTFIVGSSNDFAHAACTAVSQNPGTAYNPLFMYGGVGLGKTHLMQAVGDHALSNSQATVLYVTSEAFLNDYIDHLQKKSLASFRRRYRHADILLIDDIQFLAGKERIQEEFFHTFNELYDRRKQIVLTCDRPASEIPGLQKRLVSRFEWGLVTQIEEPDVETRIAILRTCAQGMHVALDDKVLEFLAERIRSNIRRLEGALTKLISYASLMRKPVTIQMASTILRDMLDSEHSEKLMIEDIQRGVAEFYSLRLADLVGNRRPAHIAAPRQIAMYLSRKLTEHSLPEIGRAFERNHATVHHAIRTVETKMKGDADLRGSIRLLSDRLVRS